MQELEQEPKRKQGFTSWMPGDPWNIEDMANYKPPPEPEPEEDEETKQRKERKRAIVGIDVGKLVDSTAVVVVEPSKENDEQIYNIRRIFRIDLDTPYDIVAEKIKSLDAQLHEMSSAGMREITYVIDATGVGEGPTDMIVRLLPYANVYRVYLTAGIHHQKKGYVIHLPKFQMASTLVKLFEGKRLHISKNDPLHDALVSELLNYQTKINEKTAHESFGAFRSGTHDDLSCALGIACWFGEWQQNKEVRFWR